MSWYFTNIDGTAESTDFINEISAPPILYLEIPPGVMAASLAMERPWKRPVDITNLP